MAAAPFELEYYIPGKAERLVASYDGAEYVNCRPDGKGIIVSVDYSEVKLGMGELRCKVRYYLTNENFKDGIFEPVSDVEVGITLHRGESDDVEGLVAYPLPSYHVVEVPVGGGGDVNLSDYYTKKEVDSKIPTKVSQLTNDKGYLTAHQDLSSYAKKSELPKKVSELTNDSGYATESYVAGVIANAITNTLNTEV